MAKHIVERTPSSLQVVPAILAADITTFNRLIEQTSRFAGRVSIDFTDGEFTPSKTINVIQAHWPEGLTIDFHLMYARPQEQLETVISLRPHLAVIHAEAEGDLAQMLGDLQAVGIKAGVALLPATSVDSAASLIQAADHVLVFGGKLGSYGGGFDEAQLPKIAQIKTIKPTAEVSWDGGVNHDNISKVAAAGADVITSGGYIQNAEDPAAAYGRLLQIINSTHDD